ncbi:bifunctional lysylphosphatidylglycerol synthetase/lysine--tRNA ligase LysX [Buchananella hordeovulneris]|nr:bifunctional lysylphosphatidylglycerol synthetase/lysine--tRNA ligase LysX [Buchananella hordeovulneris]
MAKPDRLTKEPVFVRWIPRLMMTIALFSLLSGLTQPHSALNRVMNFVELWLMPLPIYTFFTFCVCAILSIALLRRKSVAWLLLVGFMTLQTTGYVYAFVLTVRGELDFVEIGVSRGYFLCLISVNLVELGLLLFGFIWYRRWYCARVRRGNLWRALGALLIGLTISALIVVLLHGLTRGLTPQSLSHLAHGLLLPEGKSWEIAPWLPRVYAACLGISWLAALSTLMTSQRGAELMTLADEARVRELLARYGGDSLSYFATRRDKSVVFAGEAAVAYRAVLGCALASGDPIGNPSDWQRAAEAFVDVANSYGWAPAVIGTSRRGAAVYHAAGLKVLQLGDEAVLSTTHFNLAALPEVRRAVRKLTDGGYTLRVRRHGDISDTEMAEIASRADAWRQGEDERGFSMALGRLGDPADRDCVLVEALFADGKCAGLLSFVPWGSDGVSLDLMRRSPLADNGVTEFMVAGLLEQATSWSIARISLNFAVFRATFAEGGELGASPLKQFNRRLMLFASRWWQLESLYRSNAKYDPQWLPRLIAFRETSDLGNVALAMGVAEGFVKLPARFTLDVEQPRLTPEQALPMLPARPEPAAPTSAVPEQVRHRLERRTQLLNAGIEPYPVDFTPDTTCAALAQGQSGTLAGRVVALRDHGGVVFVDLQDWTGELQLILERDRLADSFPQFADTVQLGDQIGVHGVRAASRTGTDSLLVDTWRLTNKAMRPLPSRYYGLKDPEARVRQRYLDLVLNPEARDRLQARSRALQAVREQLLERDYLEVETPILQAVHGGANARPFITHINAYDMRLYMRIAPELYLKRLLVGGAPRVFEMGRNFRNEGADATHNPEFTMLEAYHAYADYHVMAATAQDLVRNAALAALGTTVVRGTVAGQVHEVDLAEPWRRVSVHDAIGQAVGQEITPDTPQAELERLADRLGISLDPRWSRGAVLTELYEHLCEATTVAPTFFYDFPAETSPLTRPHRQDARLAERWDLVVFGSELGTAYSELVDPVLQRQRLTEQSLLAARGDAEAMELDDAFLTALEYGMPPAGGLGMGLDRLVMLLTNTSIRDTIAFPLVKPNR